MQFHWDTDKANCMRCRVRQSWAGNGWGGMVIPRVGMEVVVEFLDGDPDQPLVTGCVYNGRSKVPYDLPANKTRSTFKTKTHKGGGFNELRLEDNAGEEEVFLHAQKDMSIGIRNNKAEQIGGNSHQQTARNLTSICAGLAVDFSLLGRILSSTGTMSITTGVHNPIASMDATFFASGGTISQPFENLLLDIEDHRSVRAGSIVLNSGADLATQANGQITIGANESITMSTCETISVAAKETIRHTSGQSIMQYAKENMVIASDGAMILRAGNSELILKPNGEITIKGTKILLEAGRICLN